MMRLFLYLLIVVFFSAPVQAQDMPLKDFILEKETWKKAPGSPPRPRAPLLPGNDNAPSSPVCSTLSARGGTLFVGFENQKYLWAYRINTDGTLDAGQPYGTLRTPVPAARNLRNAGTRPVAVTSMTTDNAGRIYAATELGIQVFDPTGRLSGVLMLPTNDRVEQMGWEGERRNELVIWAGGSKWTRLMNTSGK